MPNEYESGARKLEAHPEETDRDTVGLDAAANRPHGLAQNEHPDTLRQSDGVRPVDDGGPATTDTVALGAGVALARHSKDAGTATLPEPADLEAESLPQNGDIRYDEETADDRQDPSEEDDDNPYQESDEALPEDGEERAIAEKLPRP